MSDMEILITKIGELVSCEIDDVNKVEYIRDKKAAVIIVMQNGKRYELLIRAITLYKFS